MPSVPPLSTETPSSSSKPSHQADSDSRASVDMGGEVMQSEYGVGVGDEPMLNTKLPAGAAADQATGAHEVSRVLPPYELQPLPGSMFYNKDFTTNPFAYATTQPTQTVAPTPPPPHQYGYHPYRVPHSSSPPSLFGGQSMMSMPSFMSTMQDSYGPLTNPSPSPAGSVSSSMGSPISSFGSHMSDLSSMGYSPQMHAPVSLPGMAYANPRELTSRRPRTSHRRTHTRSVKSEDEEDDDDEMLDDDVRTGLGISGAQSTHAGPLHDPKAEAGRLSRIQSEQKRRNVLKDGFERLRAILPPTNQKGSKQVILDRAVQHIDAIKTSNTLLYEERGRLMEENRRLTDEILELRRANNLLVSSRIPGSSERGPNGHSSASSTSSRGSAHYSARP